MSSSAKISISALFCLKLDFIESETEGSGMEEENLDSTTRVRLGDYICGKSKCHKGNVYVDDKPVCDDGWDDTDARVVCKELGFSEGGYATKESYFGKVDLERQTGFDEVRCSGRESSLVDCRHESVDDCGDGEGAGVVCYRDEEDYYDEEIETLSSGSSSSASVPLTSAGNLVMADNTTYKAGEFCMAGVFQGEDEWDKEMGEGEAVAVMCEPCKSEVGNFHHPNDQHFHRSSVLFCSLTSLALFLAMRLNQMKGKQEIK